MDLTSGKGKCDIPQGGGMRRIQSLFKTLLMLIPMTAVPVMAIFGIPQFFPVSASPFERPDEADRPAQSLERRVGQSHALLVRSISTEPAKSVDLFQPYDAGVSSTTSSNAGVVANAASIKLARHRTAWQDPLGGLKDSSVANFRANKNIASRSGTRSAATTSSRQRSNQAGRTTAESFSGQAAIPPRRSVATGSNSDLPSPDIFSDDRASVRPTSLRSDVPRSAQASDDSRRQSQPSPDKAARRVSPAPTLPETITWREAVDRLNELGIRTFRLTPDAGQNGYRFVCLVTSVDDPRISRRFEAESPEPLVAVGNVLEQVENWNLHQ